MVATHILPPPVKPTSQETEFVVGDVLLISERGKLVPIEVTEGRISCHQIRPDLVARSVWYTIEFLQVEKPILAHSRIIGEKALAKVFQAYVSVEAS